jgi:hypothetical protein
MTLQEFAIIWPHKINLKADAAWSPDIADHLQRVQAWHLSDYNVAAVVGGTIWWTKRGVLNILEDKAEEHYLETGKRPGEV